MIPAWARSIPIWVYAAIMRKQAEPLTYSNIFDAVTDDKEEALRLQREADQLIASRRDTTVSDT